MERQTNDSLDIKTAWAFSPFNFLSFVSFWFSLKRMTTYGPFVAGSFRVRRSEDLIRDQVADLCPLPGRETDVCDKSVHSFISSLEYIPLTKWEIAGEIKLALSISWIGLISARATPGLVHNLSCPKRRSTTWQKIHKRNWCPVRELDSVLLPRHLRCYRLLG